MVTIGRRARLRGRHFMVTFKGKKELKKLIKFVSEWRNWQTRTFAGTTLHGHFLREEVLKMLIKVCVGVAELADAHVCRDFASVTELMEIFM